MKQMTLIEMDGFLKGKCIPSDLKVDETNDEYLVRKFGELESKLETALRECRSAGITIDNLEAKCAKMAAENSSLKQSEKEFNDFCREEFSEWEDDITETPATDAFLAEVKTEARKEGAYFVANRMLAAWEAGFIDDTAKNAADIARMILTSTEFMANAPEGDFDRSFSDGVL
ncbi:TPA: hypothetical protein IRO58_005676, partial [Escherichia coli]|nr:hypothetical protein [Escherichia coli]HAG6146687.1 hypothetical protein [Escherichia coli]HAG6310797.1 hypothetical protein [Escherichia coli]HAO9927052.1 hypothetical protein [Escherichia coli]HAO9953615.1 hypothetical protein [Escherichia coli]